jgi:hypothetical protein
MSEMLSTIMGKIVIFSDRHHYLIVAMQPPFIGITLVSEILTTMDCKT